MRIGIDARWIFPRISGVGRVTEKLIYHLGKIDSENSYYLLFSDRDQMEKYGRIWRDFPRLHPVSVPWNIFSPGGQLLLFGFLKKLDLDLFHVPNYFIPMLPSRLKIVSTIHDLIPLKFPQFTPRAKKTRFNYIFRQILKRCARRSDHVISVSEHTRRDLVKYLGLPGEKISVVHNGIDGKYGPLPEEVVRARLRQKFGLTEPFILYVGRFDPYKNVVGLVREFERMAPEEVKLVLAGHYDPRYPEAIERIGKPDLADRTLFLDGVDEEDLIYLYNGARVLVLPSYYEGFGLPPLEAMACGTAVISSNRGSLPEVVGEAGIIIDPDEDGALAGALTSVCSDRKLREELSEKGLKRSRDFSWEKTARETLGVYKKLAPPAQLFGSRTLQGTQ